MKFLHRQCKDAWSLFVAPGIAALLPWRLGFAWLRWLSRNSTLYNEWVVPAARVAAQTLCLDEVELSQQARLVLLLDHCDLYLSIVRRWRNRLPAHVTCRGSWPAAGPFIATGFHYGNGHWIFQTFRNSGLRSAALYAYRDRSQYRGAPVQYWYGSLRIRDVERLANHKGVFRPRLRKLIEALREGLSITALADIPPRLAPTGQRPVQLLGCSASLPDGLIHLAKRQKAPLVPFWTEFDLEQGTRVLVIGEPIAPDDVDATAQMLADILDRRIRATPAAWLFWSEWPQWQMDAEAAKCDPALTQEAPGRRDTARELSDHAL